MNSRDYAYTVSLAAGGILAAGLIFYFIWGKEFVAVPACIIYRTAGIWCPACGGTRAVLEDGYQVLTDKKGAFRQPGMPREARPA